MIRRRLSAVFLVRDGFTGRSLQSGAELRCRLDGAPCAPLWKAGGYLVLCDLPEGEHTLAIERRLFLPESRTFSVGKDGPWEDAISPRAGAGYPFPPESAVLELTLVRGKAPSEEPVWMGMSPPSPLKLAQDDGKGSEIRLFCRNPALLPLPGTFLLPQKEGGELVGIKSLEGEVGKLERPLLGKHPRGTELVPMLRYFPNAQGRLRAVFSRAGKVWLYSGEKAKSAELAPGSQTLEWDLKERN